METKKLSEQIKERLILLKDEVSQLEHDLLTIERLELQFISSSNSMEGVEPKDDTNGGIIKSIIEESNNKNPPEYPSSGRVMELFAERKKKDKPEVEYIVYNTISTLSKKKSEIVRNGKGWAIKKP